MPHRELRAQQAPHAGHQSRQHAQDARRILADHVAQRAARVLDQFLDRRADQRLVARIDVQHAREVAGHDEDQLVDVLGELAEARLGLAQRNLGPHFLGQVVDDRHHVARMRFDARARLEQRHHALVDRQPLAVGAQHHIARPVDLRAGRQRLAVELGVEIGELARIDLAPGAADDLLARQSGDLLAGAVQADEAPGLGLPHRHQHRQVLDHQVEVVAHPAQFFLGASPCVDVHQRQDQAALRRGRVERRAVAGAPERAAVGPLHQQFERVALILARRVHDLGADTVPVGRMREERGDHQLRVIARVVAEQALGGRIRLQDEVVGDVQHRHQRVVEDELQFVQRRAQFTLRALAFVDVDEGEDVAEFRALRD